LDCYSRIPRVVHSDFACDIISYHDRIIEVLTTIIEPWTFKKGRILYPDEERDIKSQMTIEDGHLWIKDTAYVGMYWWEGIVAKGGKRWMNLKS
jgi:hypothetical protein